ncbi:MAG: MFS transporter [Sphingomonadales bacterium]|nr:MFS transporter [Sphingomonadales bacterium]
MRCGRLDAARRADLSVDVATMSARQKSLALITLVVALVLEIVDLTIVNTALPLIKAEIGADSAAAQGIVAGYSLAFALLLMAGGRLGDSFGYRRVFVLGVTGFTLASAGCGLARTGGELVAARLLQGATGAIMAPQSLALMQVLFDPLERVAKMAMFGLIGGLAAIAGPILGGLLIQADVFGLGWRIVFLINLPVGVAAIAAALAFLPPTRSTRPAGYDLPGMVLFALAVAAVFWPLVREGGSQHAGLVAASLLMATLLLWLGWRHVGRRVAAGLPALFDPALFAIPSFRLGLAMSVAFAAANAGFLLVFAFALQVERGQTPLATGLLHMPFGFGAMLGIGVLGRTFLPRFGRWVLVAGTLAMALAVIVVMAGIGPWAMPLPALVPGLVLAGTGMGTASGSIGPVAVAQVDRAHAGAASSLLKTCQQFGSAAGVALVGALYFGAASLARAPAALVAAATIALALAGCALLALRLPGDIFARRAH